MKITTTPLGGKKIKISSLGKISEQLPKEREEKKLSSIQSITSKNSYAIFPLKISFTPIMNSADDVRLQILEENES